MMRTQTQMFYEAQRKAGELNELFMEMINDPVAPMTNDELKALIAKRPEVYGKFSGFVGKLAQ